MFTMKCRFAEIFSCAIGDKDFEQLKVGGLKGDDVYKWLDEMHYVVGGITSNDFTFKINDHQVVQTLEELSEHFDVHIRPVVDLTESGNEQLQKFLIVENSKVNQRNIEITIGDTNRLSFEIQQVMLGGDWELTLVYP